jgi:hypothetical protein
MLANIFSELFREFTNWGVGQILSILISLAVIALCLPFTYIGFSIRKAVEIRYKKYQGYNIRKFEKRAIAGLVILTMIEIILYFILSETLFTAITFIISLLLILGLFGIKITFNLEELLFGWLDKL